MSAKSLFRGFLIGTISTAAISGIWAKQRTTKEIDIEYQEPGKSHPSQDYLRRASEILRFGEPDAGTQVRFYKNHVLAYDQAKKIPIWVAEHLTAENLKGDANRKHSFFKPDAAVTNIFQSDNKDYLRSGWSRGHMAPAGNNKHDQTAMDETFFLSNILPQDLDNNSGFWNRFEMYCRDLTKSFTNVYVISGPLFLSHEDGGKHYVKYQVIGENEVAVPTHLYKLLVTEDQNHNLQTAAFIIPNIPMDNTHKLTEYQVPLEHLETKTGVKFLKNLERQYQDLCSVDGCKLVDGKDLDMHFLRRDFQNVKNYEGLRKVWTKVEKKGLQGEKSLQQAYNEKKAQLKNEF